MKMLLPLMFSVIAFSSCTKDAVVRTPIKNNNLLFKKSYAVVSCDSCKIIYPSEKIKDLDISGTSPKLVYNYASGKTLKTNIYALGQEQDIIYTVYNPEGQIVYHNSLNQSADDAWDIDVLLP